MSPIHRKRSPKTIQKPLPAAQKNKIRKNLFGVLPDESLNNWLRLQLESIDQHNSNFTSKYNIAPALDAESTAHLDAL